MKSGPTQLARRLVATDEQIFATLDIDGPVEALDAASGKALRKFAGSEQAEEILHVNGTVYILVREGGWELKDYIPKFNTGDQARVRTEFVWDARPRKLIAYNAKTGKRLWEKKDKITPLSVAVAEGTVAYYNGDQVVTLNEKTGKVNWTGKKASRRSLIPFNFAPRLVIYKDVVLFAGGEGKMQSFDLKSGKQLWEQKHDPSGYQSPQDLLVERIGLVGIRDERSRRRCVPWLRSADGRDEKGVSAEREDLLVSSSLLHREGHGEVSDAVPHGNRVH